MEQRLAEQWLIRLPKNIAQHTVHIEEVGTGRADSVFIQLDSGLEYFVKLSKSELIYKEKLVLSALAEQSCNKLLFPHLHPVDSSDKILITEKLTGQTPSKKQILHLQTQLVEMVAELHQLEFELTELEFAVPNKSKLDLALQQSELSESHRAQIQSFYGEYEAKLAAVPSYPAVNHGDLTPLNILLAGNQWQLIDWEYGCKTDARWDLATLTIEFGLTKSEAIALVTEYQQYRQLSDSEFVVGFESWQYFYLVTCLVWAVDNQTDVSKYSSLFTNFVEDIKK